MKQAVKRTGRWVLANGDEADATYYAGNKRTLNAVATMAHCVKVGYDSAMVPRGEEGRVRDA